jgi:hypothetical protein
MTDRKLLRLSATVLFIGEIVLTYYVQYVHPGGAATNQETFEIYAASSAWAAIHLAEFISTAILLAGLLVLYFALNLPEGTPRWLGFFAAVSTGVALVLVGVLYAIDGVALKQAVDTWASAPTAEQAARFASAEAIRWLEWGTNSYQGYMFGLALLLFGTAIVWTARVPRPIGFLMGMSGLAFIDLDWLVGTRGFTSADAVPTQIAWLSLYALTIWMLIVAWRQKESIPSSVSAQSARKMSTN